MSTTATVRLLKAFATQLRRYVGTAMADHSSSVLNMSTSAKVVRRSWKRQKDC